MMMIGGGEDSKCHLTMIKMGRGSNMCFNFKVWLPEYRTDIALGEGNTNLNSKIKE